MYCINCGVKLADTEKKCPLCGTTVYHPDLQQAPANPLYPIDKMPKPSGGRAALCGAVLILFFIPILVCLFADISLDGKFEWSGYVAGALTLAYIAFALPRWFRRPNPVIFVPSAFAAAALYLFYINYATGGAWFLTFALPLVGGIALITSAVVTLLHYLRRGRLYIFGGAFIALGLLMPVTEFLMQRTFSLPLIGWSVYPLVVLALFGGLLIHLAINSAAREMIERKLFF
jgi:hypothetical protein